MFALDALRALVHIQPTGREGASRHFEVFNVVSSSSIEQQAAKRTHAVVPGRAPARRRKSSAISRISNHTGGPKGRRRLGGLGSFFAERLVGPPRKDPGGLRRLYLAGDDEPALGDRTTSERSRGTVVSASSPVRRFDIGAREWRVYGPRSSPQWQNERRRVHAEHQAVPVSAPS